MPIFWEEFGKWRCSSIYSWPRNQTETVGRIRCWLSWSLNLPVRSEDNRYPSQESNSISSCSLVSVQKYRKMEERITNSLSVQNTRTHCEQRIVSYIVNLNCFFAIFLVIIVFLSHSSTASVSLFLIRSAIQNSRFYIVIGKPSWNRLPASILIRAVGRNCWERLQPTPHANGGSVWGHKTMSVRKMKVMTAWHILDSLPFCRGSTRLFTWQTSRIINGLKNVILNFLNFTWVLPWHRRLVANLLTVEILVRFLLSLGSSYAVISVPPKFHALISFICHRR
jgi:hypothetical protein